MGINSNFWRNKKVFITGHSGFKGGWLSLWLQMLGSDIKGFSLAPLSKPNIFEIANVQSGIISEFGDIRNYDELFNALDDFKPEIIFHLAAQPLVRYSYNNPVDTYSTNIMGLVNLFDISKKIGSPKAIINVTSDKCYQNNEWIWPYKENDQIGGRDPYSNSKACAELITASFRDSFFNLSKFNDHNVGIATARSGNVIGGGDWASDRIIPDFIRASENNTSLLIRYPNATRPWQHVLEPLNGYITLAEHLFKNGKEFSQAWNFGPTDGSAHSVQWLVETFKKYSNLNISISKDNKENPHEATYLRLDSTKAQQLLGWRQKWNSEETVLRVAEWYKAYKAGVDMKSYSRDEISDFISI